MASSFIKTGAKALKNLFLGPDPPSPQSDTVHSDDEWLDSSNMKNARQMGDDARKQKEQFQRSKQSASRNKRKKKVKCRGLSLQDVTQIGQSRRNARQVENSTRQPLSSAMKSVSVQDLRGRSLHLSSSFNQLDGDDNDRESEEDKFEEEDNLPTRNGFSEVNDDLPETEDDTSPSESPDSSDDERSRFEQSCGMYDSDECEKILAEDEMFSHGLKVNAASSSYHNRPFYEPMLSVDKLKHLLRSNPQKYKRCIARIQGSHRTICTNMDANDSDGISEIEISGRSKCGKVFNEDEVVVEIYNFEKYQENLVRRLKRDINRHNKTNTVYGVIKGILQRNRFRDIEHPVFVCTIDESATWLAKPLCKTVPKLYLRRPKDTKEHQLSIYKISEKTGNITYDRCININRGNRDNYVFLVVYISWEDTNPYPHAAILQEYKTDNRISSGLKILRLQHQIPKYYKQTTVEQMKSLLDAIKDDNCLTLHSSDREDFSDKLHPFTIDPPKARDLDDALSVEYIDEKTYRIGVHIADVTSIVEKGDAIDLEAQERATTYYPGQGYNPYHMLPEPLAKDICSLLPHKKRPAVSIFIIMKEDEFPKVETIKLTYIKSQAKLTYEEAQRIIMSQNGHSGVERRICRDIQTLSRLSSVIRKQRLGNAMFAFPVETGLDADKDSILFNTEAHYLVEEFMVFANFSVACYLNQNFPYVLPLRCQDAPSADLLQRWRKENDNLADMILCLQGRKISEHLPKLGIENLGELRYRHIKPLQKCVWEDLKQAVERRDVSTVRKIMGADELHPMQSIALGEWIDLQESAEYRCSGDVTSTVGSQHFSLRMTKYVHFTSPIRRYPDIIVHRLVHAAISNARSPYTQSEVTKLCTHINKMTSKAKRFQNQCSEVIWGRKLKKSPLMVNAMVKEFSESVVKLVIPGLRKMPARAREISLNLMNIHSRAEMIKDHDRTLMKLKWRRRLYHVRGKHGCRHLKRNNKESRIHPHQREVFIQQNTWIKLMKHNFSGNISKMKSIINDTGTAQPDRSLPECVDTVPEVTSENPDGNITRQCCKYSLSICRGQVFSVQLSSENQRGVLNSSLQLINMTDNITHCLQHARDPIKFLTKYSTKKSEVKYNSTIEYLTLWLPILEMESATNAVLGDSSNISNVPVTFHRGNTGRFFLQVSYCEERDIEFSYMSTEFILTGKDDQQTSFDNTDYLCVRCPLRQGKHPVSCFPKDANPREATFWVSHAQVKKVEKVKIKKGEKTDIRVPKDDQKTDAVKKYEVTFDIHKQSPSPTEQMMTNGQPVECSVELLQKTESDKRIESILKCLREGSRLVKSIALSEKNPKLDRNYINIVKEVGHDVDIPGIAPNNVGQDIAIHTALTSSFSLIHGPPGTGKTCTGMKLVYLFNQVNQIMYDNEHTERLNQIVFCGPSNKSVDLVADWMKDRFREHCPKMVRIYGTSLENKLFPVPGRHFSGKGSSNDSRPDDRLADISMHNLIRLENREHSAKIKEYDKWFKEYLLEMEAIDKLLTQLREGDPIPSPSCKIPTLKDIKDYKSLVSEAVQDELQYYSVVFCTTAVATSPRFMKATKGRIFQLIIDENGMCTEPESISTILATHAKQVVLIGDHKQLRPVVTSTYAAELGLEKSLFERYSGYSVMLSTQYRMHPMICEFPSRKFYKGRLKTALSLTWEEHSPLSIWRRQDVPLVFCHVEGEEKYLAYATEEGNERSCSNEAEIEQVVKVFEHLVEVEKVTPENKRAINIMTQYNAQKHGIKEALLKKGFINTNVNTVVGSQGSEWNYVIFSTVRSLPKYRIEKHPTIGWSIENLGFITDGHQINVALTRARRGLIIIGNMHLLSCDPVWRQLIRFYAQHGCVVEVDQEEFPKRPPKTRTKRKKKQPRPETDDIKFYKGTDKELEMSQIREELDNDDESTRKD